MRTERMDVFGLVQGVGFRAAVTRCANSLGLVGYVRNNADGSVTAVVSGPDEKVEMFELMVRNGCGSLARVDSVKTAPYDGELTTTGFRVR